MIKLDFHEPNDPEWVDWKAECDKAVAQIPAGAAKPTVDPDLYKEMRDRFLAATHKKCAYCELFLPPGQRKGDVEHYRPKGRVRDRRGKKVKLADGDGSTDHPGYFWLAYKWENLLPSCSACNRRAGDAATGQKTGKGEIFPTLNSWWATDPSGVDDEQPALLNPWFDDPDEHLVIDTRTGIMGHRTERGRITIKVLGLNRDGLPEARKKAIRETSSTYWDWLKDRAQEVVNPANSEPIDEINDGSAEYLGARLAAIRQTWKAGHRDDRTDPPPGIPRLQTE